MRWPRTMLLWALLLAFGLSAWVGAPASAQQRPLQRTGDPVVVELFTSQSCDSCGRANRFLGELAQEGDVIALTFPVDYWDYLGWRDTFAQDAFTRRQRDYRRSFGVRGLSTPEIVVNGLRHVAATRSNEVEDLLAEVARAPLRQGPSVAITRAGRNTSVDIGRGAGGPADVWVIAFDPGPIWETIGSGVNRGRRFPHYNLVRELRRAGAWSSAPAHFDRVYCPRDCAIIVQATNGGPILAAARTPVRR